MKKLLAVSITLCALNANAAMESKSKVKYRGDADYKSFCQAVVIDDVDLLKKSLRKKIGKVASTEHGVKELLISKNGVKCNGTGLTEFSKDRAASQVSAFLQTSK